MPVKEENPFELDPTKKLKGQLNAVTNYIFRGVSQTNNRPGVQGGLSYSFPSTGIYGSVWASNVAFTDNLNQAARMEWEPSVGIANTINDHMNYDVSLTRFFYPTAGNNNYNELNAYFNYYILATHFAYSNDEYATRRSGAYYNVGINTPVPPQYVFQFNDVSFTAAVGYFDLPYNVGLKSYVDYAVTLNKVIHHFACSLQWTTTNRRSVDHPALTGNQFVLMIGRSF